MLFAEPGLQSSEVLQLPVVRTGLQPLIACFRFWEGTSLTALVAEEQIPFFQEATQESNLLADRTLREEVELFSVLFGEVIGAAQDEVTDTSQRRFPTLRTCSQLLQGEGTSGVRGSGCSDTPSSPKISSSNHSVGSSGSGISLGISPLSHLFMVLREWPVRLRMPRMENPCS